MDGLWWKTLLKWMIWGETSTIFGSTSTLFPCKKHVLKNRKEITEEVANCRANAADAAAARECRLDAVLNKYIYINHVYIYVFIYTSFYVHMQHMLHMPLL